MRQHSNSYPPWPYTRRSVQLVNFLSSKQKNWFEKTWPSILIVGAWLWLFWPMISGHTVCGFRDSGYLYYPLFKWIDAQWAAGDIPLWNQYDQFGVPVVADGSSSVFYPGKLVFFLRFLSYEARYGIYLAVHVLIAAASCFWFARRLGCGQGGATLAAVSYAFGGSVLFQVCNVIYLVGAAWLPAALGCVWLMYKKKSFSWAITGGFFCALIMLGGDPQLVYNIGLIGLGTIGGEFLLTRKRNRGRGKQRFMAASWLATLQVGRLTVLALVAVILSAIQVLPASEWAATSERARFQLPRSIYELATVSSEPYRTRGADDSWRGLIKAPAPDIHHDHAFQFSQPPWTIVELLFPNISGQPFPRNGRWSDVLLGADRMWVPSLYSGCLAAIFGLISFRLWGKRRRQVWLSRVGLFFALGSFGWYGLGWLAGEFFDLSRLPIELGPQTGGVYWLLIVVFPKYIMFRYPAKLFVIVALAMCVLAGLSVNRLRFQSSTQSKFLLSVSIGCFVAMFVVFGFSGTLLAKFWESVPPDPLFGPFDSANATRAIQFALFQVVIISLSTLFLIRNSPNISRTFCWFVLSVIAMIDVLFANHWMVANINSEVYVRDVNRVFSEPPLVILPYPSHWLTQSSQNRLNEIALWQRETLFPKHHLEIPMRHIESFSSIELGVPIDHSRLGGVPFTFGAGRGLDRPNTNVVEQRNGYLKIIAETLASDPRNQSDSDRTVRVSTINLPDWRVTNTTPDSQTYDAIVVPWENVLIAVRVPLGKCTVELTYHPQAFYRGAWISGIGWIILLLLAVFRWVRKSRH